MLNNAQGFPLDEDLHGRQVLEPLHGFFILASLEQWPELRSIGKKPVCNLWVIHLI